ncbi:heat shock protein DnaJ, partial [Lentithecium fluviatile CBS 122367]
MESLLPPDPYKALGVPRDADIALIKKTFRKLALSCHPDKVADESLKQRKQEEFHKINQAYELIGDEASRQRYD